ncbi:hypothetical protein [Nocardia sp. NPDC055049]
MAEPGPGDAIELAVTYISIVGETSKIPRAVKNAMLESQLYVNRNPLTITARVDVQNLTGHTIQADVVPDFEHFADRMRLGLAMEMARHNWSIPVGVDIDAASAMAAFEALHSALQAAATPITQRVDVDVDRNASGSITSVSSAIGSLTKGVAYASAGAAAISAITGAAGAAAGAVGVLGVGLAALGPAAAAAGATVAVGLSGIKDTFSALKSAQDSAGADSKAQASAIAAAQKQVESAMKGVESASKDLEDANKDLEDSQKDLNSSYKDAADNLEDLKMAAADAALSEKEAAQALKEANQDLADAKTPKEREKALLRIERAQLNLAKAQEANRDAQDENREAEEKGIENSDAVTSAKDKVASATDRVSQAEQKLSDAHSTVTEAQKALQDATNKTSAAQDKAAKALAALSPNAREWVLAIQSMAPAWKEVKTATQDALFADSATGIKDLAKAALPTLKAGLVDVAGSMNGLTKQFAAFWSAPQNLAGVEAIFKGTADFIDGMGPGLQQMTQGFLSIGTAFAPVANQVGAQFAGMLGQIGQAFTDTMNNGQLTQLFSTFGDVLAGLGAGLNPLIQGLIQIGNIVGPTLGPLFQSLGEAIKSMAPALGQIGAVFAETLTAIMPQLADFISQLAIGLAPVLPVIGTLLSSMMDALTPMIGPLSQIAQVVGNTLAQAFTALQPAIGPLSTAIVSLITAIAPIIPVVAEVVAGLITALAPALTTIFDALSPVIKQIADSMMPVFKQLQPILADVATKIGNALAKALEQIAPYIPQMAQAFGDLVLAIAPMIPQLVEIALSLLPPFLDVVIAILPQVLKFIEVLTWLIEKVVIPLVIPYIKQMTDGIKTGLETVATVITTVREKIGTAIDRMKNFFGDLSKTVDEKWDGIVKKIAGSVKKIGELLKKVPSIPGISSGIAETGKELIRWAEANGAARGGFATGTGVARPQGGGRKVVGPGTGTSDSVLAMLGGKPIALSNGEFISTEQAYQNGAPLLWALNQGWVPSPEFLSAMVGGVPGFAKGGVPGKAFAESMDPASYLMGGFSRSSIDCSGMVSAVVNDALGLDAFDSRMSTVSEGSWLKNKGAKSGLGGAGDISIGWYDQGGGANGHTAMTLGDGTNVESRGTDGVVVGANARGAADSMFDHFMHLPEALLQGGDGGKKGATSGGRPAKLGGSNGSGGTGGSSGGSGGSGGTGGTGGNSSAGSDAINAFITNWPAEFGVGTGGPAATSTTGLTTSPNSDVDVSQIPVTTTPQSTLTADTSTHPLSGAPLTGELFNGSSPWYMASSPEQAFTNLQSQATTQLESTVSDVQSFFTDNWQEMVETGAGVLGMGAMSGGTTVNVTNNGMSPEGAARAVERQMRRTNLATMRSGGFGR